MNSFIANLVFLVSFLYIKDAGGYETCYNIEFPVLSVDSCRIYLAVNNETCNGVKAFRQRLRENPDLADCYADECNYGDNSCAMQLIRSNYTKQVCPEGFYCTIPIHHGFERGIYLAACAYGLFEGRLCYSTAEDVNKVYCVDPPCRKGLKCNMVGETEVENFGGKCRELE